MDVAEVIKIQNQITSKIEELRGRIGTHRGYITGSETRTRQLLIDPMLRVLGWDIENPERVHLEYPVSGGRVDYALRSSRQVVVVIEAKVLGKNLDNLGPGQLLKYAKDPDMQQLKLVVITDGDIWRIYSMESNPEKVFRISQLQPLESAQLAVDLWEQNITVTDSGARGLSVVSEAKEHLINGGDRSDMQVEQEPSELVPTGQPSTPGTKVGWIPLTRADKYPKWKSSIPKRIRFENAEEVELKSGIDLLDQVILWIWEKRRVTEDWLEFSTDRGGKPVTTSRDDRCSPLKLKDGLYFNKISYYSRKRARLLVTKKLLDYFGYDASKVYVKFD